MVGLKISFQKFGDGLKLFYICNRYKVKTATNLYHLTMYPVNPIEHLQRHGIKPSPQRIAVMDYLLSSRVHPTADEIYMALSPTMPTLSKTTVYNTLKLLVEQGAVLNLGIDERNARYDGDTTPHAHFRCLKCGTVIDLYPHQVEGLELVNHKQLGNLRIAETRLYYMGYCEHCQNSANNTMHLD